LKDVIEIDLELLDACSDANFAAWYDIVLRGQGLVTLQGSFKTP
jgi:hypothetical protein